MMASLINIITSHVSKYKILASLTKSRESYVKPTDIDTLLSVLCVVIKHNDDVERPVFTKN